MTRYIDSACLRRLASLRGVPTLLMEMADAIREDFLRWEEFDKSPRLASHSPVGVIELMPIADDSLYAFKYVNGHPNNPASDLLTVMAFGVLAQVDTGYPLFLSELTITTALRTAATSALAAKAMARPDARVMALIGNGAQSEFQALAFHAMNGIREIRAYDVDPAATAKLMGNLAEVSGLSVVPAGSVAEAVDGADIVTTVTADKTRATILSAEMVRPGMHINAVGGDCPGKTELDSRILDNARVVVEYAPQTRIEGEIQQMPGDFPVTELWQVLRGREMGREHAEEVTVFDSVGFALEDFSALRYLMEATQRHGLGSVIELIPKVRDPKNLFQVLHQSEQHKASPVRLVG
ncbi:MAG: ornithine cyclodeaminase [Proteobacteria bacterium]|nr:ornithine cyclodeaminase [Pseudomonadota bacterium]